MASNHIMLQNISSIEDVASVVLFTSQAKQNGEPFPIHVLLSLVAINKKALETCNSWSTFVLSYGVNNAVYHRVKRSIE